MDNEKTHYIELSVEQWERVIDKAKEKENKELYLFVLYSLANQQVVTSASINAFENIVVEEARDRKIATCKAITSITTIVRNILNDSKADFYCWNYVKGEWTIGYYQTENLRKALGGSKKPDKP